MKTTCALNSIICPVCGYCFDSEELHDYPSEHATLTATYKEPCPKCNAQLMISYKLQKWFTAEKLEDIS